MYMHMNICIYIFGRNDAEAEAPVLWPPHAKSWLIGKDSDAGRDWGQEEKGTTEDEMASLTRWTWVWVNSGSWWWTGRPGVLRFMGSQRVGQDWATELNWTELQTHLSNTGHLHSGYITMSQVQVLWMQTCDLYLCILLQYSLFWWPWSPTSSVVHICISSSVICYLKFIAKLCWS